MCFGGFVRAASHDAAEGCRAWRGKAACTGEKEPWSVTFGAVAFRAVGCLGFRFAEPIVREFAAVSWRRGFAGWAWLGDPLGGAGVQIGELAVLEVPEPELQPLEDRGLVPGFPDVGARFPRLGVVRRFPHIVSVGDSHLDLLALRLTIREQYAPHDPKKEDNFTCDDR